MLTWGWASAKCTCKNPEDRSKSFPTKNLGCWGMFTFTGSGENDRCLKTSPSHEGGDYCSSSCITPGWPPAKSISNSTFKTPTFLAQFQHPLYAQICVSKLEIQTLGGEGLVVTVNRSSEAINTFKVYQQNINSEAWTKRRRKNKNRKQWMSFPSEDI